MQITVTLEIDETPLEHRTCTRCKGTDFRAIHHILHSPMEISIYGAPESQTTLPLSICLQCKRIGMLL